MDPSKDKPNQKLFEPSLEPPSTSLNFDSYPQPLALNWPRYPFASLTPPGPNVSFGQPQGYPMGPFLPGNSFISHNIPTSSGDQMVHFSGSQTTFSFGSPRPTQELVQFPFEITNNQARNRDFRFKRKTDSPPLQPSKQHITEEKMVEHMSRLHINSETAPSAETGSDQVQRLYMCEEMRKFQHESILPQKIMSMIQRPCTALVLWRPPAKLVNLGGEGSQENENNNAQSVPLPADEMDNEDVEVGINNMEMDNC